MCITQALLFFEIGKLLDATLESLTPRKSFPVFRSNHLIFLRYFYSSPSERVVRVDVSGGSVCGFL